MKDSFQTILKPAEGLYKEKGSKFIAFAIPVSSIDEIKKHLQEKRKTFYDARHICYAYMLGAERNIFRTNDDGEPSSTAGKPILGQINSNHLTDIVIIVVRYFGGVLLGTGGLTAAYKNAAANAIAAAEIIEKDIEHVINLKFGYNDTNQVMQIIKEYNLIIAEKEFDYTENHWTLKVPQKILQKISMIMADYIIK